MRNTHAKDLKPINDINMTPFIDIMLVLLIVFMITAPLLTVGVEVDLPDTKASTMNESVEPLVISINKNNEIFIMETPTPINALVPRLKAITANKKEPIIYVQADKIVPYRILMDVIGQLNHAGFKKVGLIGAADNRVNTKR
jgi:biopolymer transport protein TolR